MQARRVPSLFTTLDASTALGPTTQTCVSLLSAPSRFSLNCYALVAAGRSRARYSSIRSRRHLRACSHSVREQAALASAFLYTLFPPALMGWHSHSLHAWNVSIIDRTIRQYFMLARSSPGTNPLHEKSVRGNPVIRGAPQDDSNGHVSWDNPIADEFAT